MKKEQVMELMNAIPADLIEEADIQAPSRHRLPRLTPAAIAACLCLALLGTAAAVQFCATQLRDDGAGTVWLSGGIAQHPYAALSDQLKAEEGASFHKAVGSWQEIEDFIGFDLMNNPVLDASPAHPDSTLTLTYGNQSVAGQYIVEASAGQDRIYAHGVYGVGPCFVRLRCTLYTDHIPEDLQAVYENWDDTTVGFHYADGTEPVLEYYTAPSGLTAQLVTVRDAPMDDLPPAGEDVIRVEESYSCAATFSINGVPFEASISCFDASEVEAARAALIQILDGFVLPQ